VLSRRLRITFDRALLSKVQHVAALSPTGRLK
jgi:hypothetical protein